MGALGTWSVLNSTASGKAGREADRQMKKGSSSVIATSVSVGVIDSFSSCWNPSGQALSRALSTETSIEHQGPRDRGVTGPRALGESRSCVWLQV